MAARDIHTGKILVLDFGSQYTQLIARRVRELGVYCEIQAWDCGADAVRGFSPAGIILSGGPETVIGSSPPLAPQVVFDLGVPVLGICYGLQAMAAQLGGRAAPTQRREFGYAEVEVLTPGPLLEGIADRHTADTPRLDVWMSHGDRVEAVPEGFVPSARTADAPVAAMHHPRRQLFGVQFHPEVTHTTQGMEILRRFVREICDCQGLWIPAGIVEDAIARIRDQVGGDGVLLGLSGGVDSSVTAALLHRAIGDQLTCVFVDNGLLRLGEADQVMEVFARHLGIEVIRVEAGERFMTALAGVQDPEAKRKVIGNTFISVFEEKAAEIPHVVWLAQGTIYPDVIESAGAATGKAQVIKSHHNVGGLPEKMSLRLLEPLRELFKDEVRRIGQELDIPREMLMRHPFPGPGLGVRILGEVKHEYADILRRADAIFMEELRRADYYDRLAQAFAVFLPVKSVGVVGDERRYQYVVALRAVQTPDFMTARWAHLPHELLEVLSNRIINEIPEVSRVVYDISGKPPATIEWE